MKINNFSIIVEPITPLHIGCGETLTSIGEFITTTDKIRFIDQDKLNELLENENQTDKYFEIILSSGNSFNTYEKLRELNIDIEKIIYQELKLNCKELDPNNNNILHLFHNENGKVYIPGSSIKGLIKTALFHNFLKLNNSYLERLGRDLDSDLANCYKYQFLKNLNFKWDDFSKRELNERNFNNLRISDSQFIEKKDVVVELVRRQHLYNIDSTSLDWLQETVKKDTTINMTIGIIPNFPSKFNQLNEEDIKSLWGVINKYSLDLIDFEISLLEDCSFTGKNILNSHLSRYKQIIESSNNEFCICRIGKGKTLYFQTILSLLSENHRNIILDKLYKENNMEDKFPLTRVLTSFDEMMGWVMIYENNNRLFENNLTNIIEKKSTIKVTCINDKSASFVLNDVKYENVQLINQTKVKVRKNEIIEVIIWQLNSKGIVNQLKII